MISMMREIEKFEPHFIERIANLVVNGRYIGKKLAISIVRVFSSID